VLLALVAQNSRLARDFVISPFLAKGAHLAFEALIDVCPDPLVPNVNET
jgi:hypothetical protein